MGSFRNIDSESSLLAGHFEAPFTLNGAKGTGLLPFSLSRTIYNFWREEHPPEVWLYTRTSQDTDDKHPSRRRMVSSDALDRTSANRLEGKTVSWTITSSGSGTSGV